MKKREYIWYLEPRDGQTNEVISRLIDEENFGERVCQDGKHHPLWQCSFETVGYLIGSKKKFNLKFKIFVQEGNGKIREAAFLYSKATR